MEGTRSERFQEALAYATKMHEGQKRKEGIPYITHPVAVAEMLRDWGCDEDYQICGLFHDLLEDTTADPADILRSGGAEVLTAVRLLTKEPGYVLQDYVRNLKENPMSRTVKAADRLHNLRSAPVASIGFRRHYIEETLENFMDLSPEMSGAVSRLAATLPEGEKKEELLQRIREKN